jgi:hypothetical protein
MVGLLAPLLIEFSSSMTAGSEKVVPGLPAPVQIGTIVASSC